MGNRGISVKEKKCKLWFMAKRNEKYVYKINHGPRTSKIPIKNLQWNKSYQKIVWNSLLLRKFENDGLSNNSLNLIVHRKTKCTLFEISTDFVSVKIKIKIIKRNGFCKRLNT